MAAASTTSNPLNDFIGAAGAVASVVISAQSIESSPTPSSSSTSSSPSTTAAPTSAAASASHTAPVAHHGLSPGAKIGIIVGCIVGALLLFALLGLCCFCLLRRRRRSKRRTKVTSLGEEEVKSWKSPISPGRHYSNYSAAQKGQVSTELSPTVPLMAAAAADHHVHNEKTPLSQHPAMRSHENPFVPEPPSPRRTAPNSRAGLTDGTVPGAAAYVVPGNQRLRKSSSRSRSSSETRPHSSGLPTHTDANRPATPFGLTGFGTPAGHTIHSEASPPYSAIGQPYEEHHVQKLQADAPSSELQHSLHNREVVSGAAFADDSHPKYRTSRGYSTPPEEPSHSPDRDNRASVFPDSSHDSELSTTTVSNSSSERSEGQHVDPYDLYQPAQRDSMPPWEQHQRRFSNSPQSSPRVAAPPPIPWEDSAYGINARKYQSHSPRQSGQSLSGDGRRRSSRSPATSINGQPRRLRFEDLQADNRASYTGIGQHESHNGYDHNNRWSEGVGEAL